MIASILNSIKKMCGIDASLTVYDADILMHINSVFATLRELGIGPEPGFIIEDASAVWEEYLGTDARLSAVKSYMYFRIKLMFDPPQTSYLIDSLEREIAQMEWRLNVVREEDKWTSPFSEAV